MPQDDNQHFGMVIVMDRYLEAMEKFTPLKIVQEMIGLYLMRLTMVSCTNQA